MVSLWWMFFPLVLAMGDDKFKLALFFWAVLMVRIICGGGDED
jgi:hypothetical protein